MLLMLIFLLLPTSQLDGIILLITTDAYFVIYVLLVLFMYRNRFVMNVIDTHTYIYIYIQLTQIDIQRLSSNPDPARSPLCLHFWIHTYFHTIV